MLLRDHGYDVVSFADPGTAEKKAAEMPFSRVIVEEDMSGANGQSLVKRLLDLNPVLKALMLTAPDRGGIPLPETKPTGVHTLVPLPFDWKMAMPVIEGFCKLPSNGSPSPSPKPSVTTSSKGRTRSAFQALREGGASRAPFQQKGDSKAPQRIESPSPTPEPGETRSPFARVTRAYTPRYLTTVSPVMRNTLEEIVRLRWFKTCLVIRGESGCAFEQVVRELLHCNGEYLSAPIVLQEDAISKEALLNIMAQSALRAGPAPIVFVPQINALDELRLEILYETLITVMKRKMKKQVRFVFGFVEGDDEASVSRSVSTLMNMAEGIIELPSLRDRPEDFAHLAFRILSEITILQPYLKVREFEPACLDYLSKQIWPGNVEQLTAVLWAAAESCQHRALALHDIEPLVQYEGDDEAEAVASPGSGGELLRFRKS